MGPCRCCALHTRVPAPGAMPTALGMEGRDAQPISSTWGPQTHLGMNTAAAKGLHASFPPLMVARSQPRSSAPFPALTLSSELRGAPVNPQPRPWPCPNGSPGCCRGIRPREGLWAGCAEPYISKHERKQTAQTQPRPHNLLRGPNKKAAVRWLRRSRARPAAHCAPPPSPSPPPHTASPPTVFSILFP